LIVAVTALAFAPVAGCARGGGKADATGHPTREELRGRIVKAPKEPDPPPARKDVPLDPALTAAATTELSAASRAGDATLRANALEAMRDVPGDVPKQAILKGLEDDQAVVRFAAGMAAGERQLEEARKPLLGMVDDPDRNVQVAVRFALHKLGITDYSHDLEDTARSDDAGVRGNTALALGLLGEKSGMKILRVLSRDRDAAVRQQSYEAMWRLGDHGAVDDLVALTVSTYVDDQMIGYLALAAPREPSVREHVRSGLTSDYIEVAMVAARAMGMLGSDEGYRIAEKGSKGGDARQRFLAALAFGAIGRTDAQPILRTLIKDKDPRVRVAAAAAVLQLGNAGGAGLAGASTGKGG
jgi:HEAT repeat protein